MGAAMGEGAPKKRKKIMWSKRDTRRRMAAPDRARSSPGERLTATLKRRRDARSHVDDARRHQRTLAKAPVHPSIVRLRVEDRLCRD